MWSFFATLENRTDLCKFSAVFVEINVDFWYCRFLVIQTDVYWTASNTSIQFLLICAPIYHKPSHCAENSEPQYHTLKHTFKSQNIRSKDSSKDNGLRRHALGPVSLQAWRSSCNSLRLGAAPIRLLFERCDSIRRSRYKLAKCRSG